MSIKGRLQKFEQIVGPPPDGVPKTVSLDEEGCIVWVNAEADPGWIGKHYSELPQGRPIKVYIGFNPSML